jgi:hypothetical protein
MTILRNKAGTIEELLDAEEKIGDLHEEIEATVSRINFLKDQVSYSTISLEFYQTIEEVVATTETPIADEFVHALRTGLDGIIRIFIALAYIWPIIIGVGVAYIIYVRRKQPSL